MNEQNLKPNSERSPKQRRENAKKADWSNVDEG